MIRKYFLRYMALCVLMSSPAYSFDLFEELDRACGDVCDEAERVGQTIGEGASKLVTELGNGASAVSNEVANNAKRLVEQIGRGVDDLKVLVTTGECNGDICEAIDAAVIYTASTLQSQVLSVEQAAQRVSEGKLVDAVWHLGVDPMNAQQEAAAKAAIKSSVIRAVGQAAATAYGGGASGAAGYSAWLAYHETGGNLELALRAGAIAGATSSVMKSTSSLTDGTDIQAHLHIDQVAQRGIISGAVAGVAVAVSGGDQDEIQRAAVAGIAMSVIRDGYKSLTRQDVTEEALKHSVGDGPCLGAGPESPLPCVEEAKASGAYYEENGKWRVDYTKLPQRMPHVGKVADGLAQDALAEDAPGMVFLSRIPGMNAMGHAHDAWVESMVGSVDPTTLEIISISTIPPFMIMTYNGTGFHVQDLIRREITAASDGAPPPTMPQLAEPYIGSTNKQGINPEFPSSASPSPAGVATAVPGLPIDAGEQPAAEIRQLVCSKDGDVRSTILELPLSNSIAPVPGARICSVDRITKDRVIHFWHAHHQANSCITKFNEIALRNLRQGRECAVSIGVRYGVTQVATDHN